MHPAMAGPRAQRPGARRRRRPRRCARCCATPTSRGSTWSSSTRRWSTLARTDAAAGRPQRRRASTTPGSRWSTPTRSPGCARPPGRSTWSIVDLPDPDETATAKLYSSEFYAPGRAACSPPAAGWSCRPARRTSRPRSFWCIDAIAARGRAARPRRTTSTSRPSATGGSCSPGRRAPGPDPALPRPAALPGRHDPHRGHHVPTGPAGGGPRGLDPDASGHPGSATPRMALTSDLTRTDQCAPSVPFPLNEFRLRHATTSRACRER